VHRGQPPIPADSRDLKELYTLAYRGCRLDASLFHPEVTERAMDGGSATRQEVASGA